ncbi:hypothetical protein IGI04_026918 [Brassica rapa subsp. trilocularis]|uniref:Uncharacterized protein n=1 Tax=Brassica rapa subsp. trilocularis TaxID=1813537 RepID=A0ABQ7KZY7_BRACM|nr:hypothetical protein IGI04_026918 [Brassica rapa subsp. trilocularis]
MSPFHNRSERFNKFFNLGLIYMFFRSGSDSGRPMESLLGNDFKEVFETTSRKSSKRLQRFFQATSWKSSMKFSDGVFFHIKSSLSLRLPRRSFGGFLGNRPFSRLQPCGQTNLGKKTNFIVSTSEITCLAHISLLQAPRISNKSDPPRIKQNLGFFWMNKERKCIKSFKIVVHGGWCMDGNDNIVNT